MKIVEVEGKNKDFIYLCSQLENFQFDLIKGLKEKGYNLTDDLNEVKGFVLYVENKPVGSIGLKRVSDEECEIVRVFVCEEHRKKGYAQILFEKVENLAKEMGFVKFSLITWSKSTAALNLYQKLGYKKGVEKKSEWYGGNGYVELKKELR